MMLRTIVIDDEPLAAMLLEGYIAKTPYLEHIATFSTAIEAFGSEVLSTADLILLDIQMPTLTGLEFSRMVDPRTRIIFTTAFNQYALDGYKVNAIDYLLKPIPYSDFLFATQRALDWFKLKDEATQISTKSEISSIYVKSEYKLIRIDLNNILYIEGLKDYVKFYIDGESKAILSLMNMKRAEEILPADQFIRVHRSYIVRKDKINVVERNQIVFDKIRVPIGDSYKSQLMDWLKVQSI